MRAFLRAFLAAMIAVWLPAGPAPALVNNVAPSPASFNVAMNQATAITITWRITRVGISGPAVFSNFGTLTFGGTNLTINRRLTRPIAAGQTNVVIVETVVVPRSLLVNVIKSGGTLTGTYTRTFSDGDGPGIPMSVTLSVNTGGAASFGISRLTLKFLDDESRATVRAVDTRLRAVARIRFTGTGLLQAAWQIATPTSTPGEELFRPLRLERRQLTGDRKRV